MKQFDMYNHLTDEQQNVVNKILNGHNVLLSALPGSGKSKVAYDIIQNCDDSNILILAYNRALNDKTNKFINMLNLPNTKHARSYTFHGLISVLTGTLCSNDEHFLNGLEYINKHGTTWKKSDFTLLILDETQDVRPSYFSMVQTLILNVCKEPHKLRILLLGDKNQLLYNFYHYDRADSRFLTLGCKLLSSINDRKWTELHLTRSFRSTLAVSVFLNALLPNHKMVPRNTDTCAPVELYICNTYRDPVTYIRSLITSSIFTSSEVLILCPSLNERSPAKPIVRDLIRAGIKVKVSRSGRLSDTSSSENITYDNDTVQVKTFCGSKGLESPFVIVLNSRRSLFESIENSTYVALSRSVKKLIIFHDMSLTSQNHIYNLYKNINSLYNDDVSHILRTFVVFPDQSQQELHSYDDIRKCIPAQIIPSVKRTTEYKTVQQLFNYVHTSIIQNIREYYHYERVVDTINDVVYEEDSKCETNMIHVTPETDTLLIPHVVNVDGIFARSFEIGMHNMMSIVGDVSKLLIEYHLSRRIRQSIRKLGRIYNESTDTHIQTIYDLGRTHLQTYPMYKGNMYTLARYIPAFTLFSLSSDAWYGFEDRIHSVDDFSFVQRPSVMLRILRILQHINEFFKYPLPPGAMKTTKRTHIKYTMYDTETCVHKERELCLDDCGDNMVCQVDQKGLMIVHTQNTDDTTHIVACCRLYIYDLSVMYVCNTYSGSIDCISRTQKTDNVLSSIVSMVMKRDKELDDDEFVRTYKI